MSLLTTIKAWLTPAERKSLAYPDQALLDLFGAQATASGVSVSPATAMSVPAVRCGVQAIAESVGQLPCHIYRRDASGNKERASDHPAQKLIHDFANEFTPAPEMRELLTRDAILTGNGFGYVVKVGDGKPQEIMRLDPASITVKVTADGSPVYEQSGAPKRVYQASQILHIRAPSLNGICGISPILQCREAVAIAIILEAHCARLFGNGARPSGLLSFKNKMTPEALAKAKAAWLAANGGSKSGGVAVIDNDATWAALTFNSTDAQFLELWNRAVLEIARALRLPPTFVMEFGRATWANSESMRRDFIDFTLRRWLSAWEGEIALKLLTREERGSYFAEFLLDDFIKGDLVSRIDAYGKAIAARILNPNECRQMENRAPYAGGDKFENPNVTAAPKDDVDE